MYALVFFLVFYKINIYYIKFFSIFSLNFLTPPLQITELQLHNIHLWESMILLGQLSMNIYHVVQTLFLIIPLGGIVNESRIN